jgi:hypothetical protein
MRGYLYPHPNNSPQSGEAELVGIAEIAINNKDFYCSGKGYCRQASVL